MKTKKQLLAILLSLVLVLGLLPGMSLTAYAEGNVASVTNGSTTTEYTTLDNALNNWTNGTTLTLLADVTANSTISVSVTKTLDLNGHGIRMTGNGSVISVGNNVSLTINDSDTTREHYITLTNYRGTAVSDTGTENAITKGSGVIKFSGGYITGGTGTNVSNYNLGGGAYVNGGTLVLNNGTILGNYSVNDGGGVWVGNTGTFTMNGGKIMLNKPEGGGAITVGNNGYSNNTSEIGTFTMNGGFITQNTSTFDNGYCGGVRANNGTIYVLGGSISDNIGGADVRIDSPNNDYLHLAAHCEIGKIYLEGSKVITIDGSLENTYPIGIMMDTPAVFTSGLSGKGGVSNFKSLIANTTVILNNSNEAKLVPAYTVTYNGNGATSGSVPTDSNSPYATGSSVTVLSKGTLAKEGYDFAGWKIENAGTIYANSADNISGAATSLTINANTTLTAQWKAKETAPDADSTKLNISYPEETITAKDGYEVAVDNNGTAITNFSVILDSDIPTVYVRKLATDANHAPSDWVAVTLAARPDAPAGLTTENATNEDTQNGKIKGTTTAMQYSADNGVNWTDASDTDTLVKPGTYLPNFSRFTPENIQHEHFKIAEHIEK